MRIAAIDIGTNTLLMVILEFSGENSTDFKIIQDYHNIARLGEGVDKTQKINEAALQRGIAILKEYKAEIIRHNIDYIKIVGTSALRDAGNSNEICSAFEDIINCPVEIISGEDEAKLSFKGSIFDKNEYTVIDIGGGSTEIISGDYQKINFNKSLNIGAVRISERYNLKGNNKQEQALAAREFLQEELKKIPCESLKSNIIAVAGTPTSLAQINLKLNEFDYSKIHKYQYLISDLKLNIEEMLSLPADYYITNYNIHPNRADILPYGGLILEEFINYTKKNDFYVSCHGLRYGVAMDYFQKLKVKENNV